MAWLLPTAPIMIEEIIACLDGSEFAEQILPLAHCLAAAKPVPLTILRVVTDHEEFSAEESHLTDWARAYNARVQVLVSDNAPRTIIAELEKHPGALPAITTHGRTAWAESILGSVAHEVVRGAGRPALLYRPRARSISVPKKIATVILALDGGKFAETVVPVAVEMTLLLQSRLLLLQVLPRDSSGILTRGDVLESSYLRNKAVQLQRQHGFLPSWDVLHGEPGDALCRYVQDTPDAILAMTTHGRSALRRAFLGSVAAHCVRHAGLPMLLYWPSEPR